MVVLTHVDGRRQPGGPADEPGVDEIVGGPGLAERLHLGDGGPRTGPRTDDVHQHRAERVRGLRLHRLEGLRLARLQKLVVGAANLAYREGDDPLAPVVEAVEGHGHLQGGDAGRPEGDREVVGEIARFDPHVSRHGHDGVRADVGGDADGHGVVRARQRLLQGDLTRVLPARVLWGPAASPAPAVCEGDGRVHEMVAGHDALLQRRRVYDGLEAGAGLAVGLGRAVELARLEVLAAHEREDLPRLGRHAHQGAHRLEGPDGLLGLDLEVDVQGGVDLQSPTVDRVLAVLGQEVVEQEVRDEIGGPVELLDSVGELAELQLLLVGLLSLGRVDPAQGLHASQNVILTDFRIVDVAQGVVASWVGDEPGQDGRLRDVQIRRGFPEVGARGRLRAPGPAPKVDGVEVELQELVLRIELLHAHGDDDLLGLAGDAPFVGQEEVARKLLGDGARPLDLAPLHEVDPEGSHD